MQEIFIDTSVGLYENDRRRATEECTVSISIVRENDGWYTYIFYFFYDG